MHLSQIKSPADIRALSLGECQQLADEIRAKIIQTVSQNGGHLSSNLGAVEITMALHRVFHTPQDKLVFDVGHQSYTHKLLTGRYDQFDTLRQYGGLSGFPKCSESEYDCFETGHASTAISAAVGLARARDRQGQNHHVIAVVGDGALTGGMCYEALNDSGNTKTRLIVVLNDNEMSIAKNVGALSQHFSQLRASAGWNETKRRVKIGLQKVPVVGPPLQRAIHTLNRSVKSLFINEGFFATLGYRYIGPVDGHNMKNLEKLLEKAKGLDMPVVIHCATRKGFGYRKAEKKPEIFHGIPPFFIESGEVQKKARTAYGRVAAEKLIELGKRDERITVVTAAMPLGTGANLFQFAYPERFIDVGIAEEHAVTMCAGMARGGMRPFFFVYSTFLQRGYDQVMHDVCMQNLPVVFLIDRAGLSNEDGQSHQGLFDFAYLRHIPRMTVLAPADAKELSQMVEEAYRLNAPCAIRYPKDACNLHDRCTFGPMKIGRWDCLLQGGDGTLLAVGSMVSAALDIAQALSAFGIELSVINASTIKPLDTESLDKVAQLGKPIFTLEEHMKTEGFGSAVLEYYNLRSVFASVHLFGVDDRFVPHGDHHSLLCNVGLDTDTLTEEIRTIMQRAGERE